MYKNTTKCNKTQSKCCKNKHGASKFIDTFETYQHAPWPRYRSHGCSFLPPGRAVAWWVAVFLLSMVFYLLGSMSKWVASGVVGCVVCGGALWCASGTVRPSSKPVARRCCGVVSLRLTFQPHPQCGWCRGVAWSRLCSSVRLRRWHSVLVWTRLTGAIGYAGDALFSSGLVSEALSESPPSFLSFFVCWCVFFCFCSPSVPL
jgi:hypothetical protein